MVGKKPVDEVVRLEKELKKLSPEETRELLLMTMYKLALTRAQLDAVTDVLVKMKLVKREELWKLTGEKFHETGF